MATAGSDAVARADGAAAARQLVLVVDDDPSIRLLCRVEPRARGLRACARRRDSLDARRGRSWRREPSTSCSSTCTSGTRAAWRSWRSSARAVRARRSRSSTGSIERRRLGDVADRQRVIAKPFTIERAVGDRRGLAAGVDAVEFRSRDDEPRSAAPPSSRRGSSSTRSSAPRRPAPCASARRSSPSRRRSSRATPISSRASSSTRCARRRSAGDGDERERLYRLRKACEGGLVAARARRAGGRAGERDPRRARHVQRRGAAAAHGAGEARRARRRTPIARSSASSSATRRRRSTSERLDADRARARSSSADLTGEPDPVARNEEEKGISLRAARATCSSRRATRVETRTRRCATAGSSGCSGPERDARCRRSRTCSYVRRLSPLESTYTKERATEVCLATLEALGFDLAGDPNIRLDLEDRPQKTPRACVIASDPPEVVHLITRAQGGLPDYQAFLHEAGHALHYAGCDPRPAVHVPPHLARPRADGDLLVHLSRRSRASRAGTRAHFGLSRRAGGGERGGDASSSRRCSSAATPRSSATSSASGRASRRTAALASATTPSA